jgi:ABC-type phosphate transport system permease subunit
MVLVASTYMILYGVKTWPFLLMNDIGYTSLSSGLSIVVGLFGFIKSVQR